MVSKTFYSTCIFVLLSAYNIKIQQSASATENTLQQVHVVFRHGDRTPDKISLYPTDPYLNDTWFPYGLGQLTNLGKKQEYELGKSLRKRYDKFLGDLYLPGIQEAMSTSMTRAQQSLQLVLAGLWPPNKQQTFVDDLPWQPIDYKYDLFENDELLGYPFRCSHYMQEFVKIQATNEVRNYLKQNKEKIDYINTKSGLEIKSVFELMVLYFGLYAEEHNNKTLPAWTKLIYPEFLEDAAKYSYLLQTATNDMLKASGGLFPSTQSSNGFENSRITLAGLKQMVHCSIAVLLFGYFAGPLVKKVLVETKDKIKGKILPEEKKIFLYSGHEFNIAHTLRALKSFKPHIPQYSSHIIFELHKVGTTYGLKIYYQDTTKEEPKLLDIPECGQFCPIDQFERLMADVMPDSSFKC